MECNRDVELNVNTNRNTNQKSNVKSCPTPLLSIIVPVYNILDYLERCVVSIQRQTYDNIEIILVDDGSNDGTGELCDRLADTDARIKVFHKENGGSSSARNYGIERAKGEYLGFVDSDDYIEPEMYEKLYSAIVKHNVVVAQIGRDEIQIDGSKLPDICVPPKQEVVVDWQEFLFELLMHRGDCSFCTKLLHKSLLQDLRFPEGVLNEDFYLFVNMLEQVGQIVSLPEQTYHVFYKIGSNTRKENKEFFSTVYFDGVVNADMVLDLVKSKCSNLETVAIRFGVFQRLEYLLHIPTSQMHQKNQDYRTIVKWLRKNLLLGLLNPYLNKKNKCYLIILAIMPKGARVMHRKMKGI